MTTDMPKSNTPKSNTPKSNIPIVETQTPKVRERLDAHVVILTNYLRPHHVVSYQSLAKRVRKLTVLLSVHMEPDRDWEAQWDDLDVHLQKNWMFTTNWKHSAGFNEPNFIHIPIDTNSQLKSLKPDIVFSYEMGMRTLFSTWYRRWHRKVPLVMVGNMSEHIEKERGRMRSMMRWLVRKGIDYFTFNGPSCKRYLESMKVPEDRMFHLPYCIDQDVVFTGERVPGFAECPLRLIYCGAMSERKGVHQFAESLKSWSQANPAREIEFSIAGTGELKSAIGACQTENFKINFLGNLDTAQLKNAYEDADICVFPTLADEWGLVPVEAMASGLPVLGSIFAQSVEALVEEEKNGWSFETTDENSMRNAIEKAMACSPQTIFEMGQYAKQSVAHITAARTAECFCNIISKSLPNVGTVVGAVSTGSSAEPEGKATELKNAAMNMPSSS
ncbi:MAG: glycosyltransferase family 4 protein [Mariniblastus sp.]